MTNAIKRVRWFWQDHGEWVLLGICCMLFTAGGYTFAARDFQKSMVAVQREYIRDSKRTDEAFDKERAYFRARISEKNDDIRRLQDQLATMGVQSGKTSQTATETLKSIATEKEASK